MKGRTYQPLPIDTSDVILPDELLPLVEVMAKKVHEVWALNRANSGWTYGDERNDQEKKHPCLFHRQCFLMKNHECQDLFA